MTKRFDMNTNNAAPVVCALASIMVAALVGVLSLSVLAVRIISVCIAIISLVVIIGKRQTGVVQP